MRGRLHKRAVPKVQGCTNPEVGRLLRDLVTGRYKAQSHEEAEKLIEHTQECEGCKGFVFENGISLYNQLKEKKVS